jgi:hypothetical protein
MYHGPLGFWFVHTVADGELVRLEVCASEQQALDAAR